MAEAEQLKESVFTISVDGTELSEPLRGTVNLVRATQVHDGPHSFEFTLNPTDPTTFPDSSFNIGAEVEIQMGFDNRARVFKGLITQVEVNYPAADPLVCIVSGYDRLHLLTRGRFTEHWESVKYSDVASAIASKCGLSGSADSTPDTFDYVAMNNQTYFSFIMDLARRVGFEVNVDDKTLNFRKPQDTSGEVATVKWGEDVRKAKFKTQSTGQVTEVHVLGYDDANKKQILGKATSSDVSGSNTGPSIVEAKFGAAPFWVSSYTVASQAEADNVAKSVINNIANEFCTVEAEVIGNPAIKAATVVKLDGVVPPYAGKYYVLRAIHEVASGRGTGSSYMTKFIGVRNNWTPPA